MEVYVVVLEEDGDSEVYGVYEDVRKADHLAYQLNRDVDNGFAYVAGREVE